MTHITLNESKLMDYYEKMMDEVYLKYFTFPSDIPQGPIGAQAESDISYYGAMGRGEVGRQGIEQKWTIKPGQDPWHLMGLSDDLFIRRYGIEAFRKIESKRVKFIRDPKYSNGLLRRRRGASYAQTSTLSRNIGEFFSLLLVLLIAALLMGALLWIYY